MRVTMWCFLVFRPSKCRNAHIQPQFWSIWSVFPNDSENLTKVCYINEKKLRNSELGGSSGCYLPCVHELKDCCEVGEWHVLPRSDQHSKRRQTSGWVVARVDRRRCTCGKNNNITPVNSLTGSQERLQLFFLFQHFALLCHGHL